MKKRLLIVTLLTSSALLSCNHTSLIGEETREVVNESMTLSKEDLFKKAAMEIEDGKLNIASTSSRLTKVGEYFKEELTKYNPKCSSMTVNIEASVENQIYTKINKSIEENLNTYDLAYLSDGYQLSKYLIDTNYYINYIPKEWNESEYSNKERDSYPFSNKHTLKTWVINNIESSIKIDNIWDITSESYKDHIHMSDYKKENSNANFLVMLTKDEYVEILKNSYLDSSNDNKLDLSKYESYGEKMYAYAFIDKLINNAKLYDDDVLAKDGLVKDKGGIGFFLYNKVSSISEETNISKKDFIVPIFGNNNIDGAKAIKSMKGIGGYLYKSYATILPNSKYPYTSCAFINYLSTTKEGYSIYENEIGNYSTLSNLNVDRTKNGHGTLIDGLFIQDNNEENVFSLLNEPNHSYWLDSSKGTSLIEDHNHIKNNYSEVIGFINSIK